MPTPHTEPAPKPKKKQQRRGVLINMRLTEEHTALVERARKKTGLSLSQTLRDLVVAEMMRQKGEYDDTRKWRRFRRVR